MQKTLDAPAETATHGEKMVELTIKFWTDHIERDKKIRPKHAWGGGVVGISRNKSHSIVPGAWRPFNSLMELGTVIERVLIENDIVIHHSKKMQKYLAEKPAKLRIAKQKRKPA
jgi:hypothetical protein